MSGEVAVVVAIAVVFVSSSCRTMQSSATTAVLLTVAAMVLPMSKQWRPRTNEFVFIHAHCTTSKRIEPESGI